MNFCQKFSTCDNPQMSLALASAYGMDTDGVRWTMNFVLQKIFNTLSVWGSEPGLISDTLELLIDMAEQSSRSVATLGDADLAGAFLIL